MKRERIFRRPFVKDMEINPFGDYQRIKLHAVEEDGVLTNVWSLESDLGAPEKVLSDAVTRRALETLFLQHDPALTITDV